MKDKPAVAGHSASVPADPRQWSEQSKQSVAFGWTREYRDIPYECWHCRKHSAFSAAEQKYTFEVKKASIDQRRILCADCWSESLGIRAALSACEAQWSDSRSSLQSSKAFLNHWLELLMRLEAFVPYKPDTARKTMLRKLLAAA